MQEDELITWISEIKTKTPLFLNKMSKKRGRYKFSLTGDIIKNKDWGLGNTVFALKTYYTLEVKKNYDQEFEFINKFKTKEGGYFDPEIKKRSLPLRIYSAIRSRELSHLTNKKNYAAETRQTIAIQKAFNRKTSDFKKFPTNKQTISAYIKNLDWTKPWASGSHFSHLIFFLANSSFKNKKELINHSFDELKKYEKKEGGWYSGTPSISEKINGIMKIITAINAARGFGKMNIPISNPKKILDIAFKAKNDRHACDIFNLLYVFVYCDKELKGKYKHEEIDKFIYGVLDTFKEYYYENGGFSFYKNRANNYYYGAKVSKGNDEPDIHGTAMFIWGISVIANYFGISKKCGIRELLV